MKGKLALFSVVALLGLGISTPAFAYGPNAASINTNATAVPPGGSLTVSGNNFFPGGSVSIVLHSTPVSVGGATVNANGSFSVSVSIPSATPPGAHTIIASDSEGDSASTGLTVTGSSAGGATPATATPDLPFSGADIAALSGVGAIALALGGMLILTSRRRRRVSE
jgi:hypothetical protein